MIGKNYFYTVMRYRQGVVFWLVTFVFVLSRIIIFNGFNGSDDLHYAMLAVQLIKGTYNPFEPNDIFSGRIVLIALQALIYKLGGVGVFTTAAGTVIAVILSCKLTIFSLLPQKNVLSVLLATSLFYFNPALTQATIGILPDAYIMLAGTIILVLLKKDFTRIEGGMESFTNAFLIGFIIAISLLIKETALVFLPTTVILALFFKSKRPALYITKILTSFTIVGILFMCGYYFFAGDPLFKLVQIRNSSYSHPCNLALRPVQALIIRLTYGVWQSFIVNGFYPVVLALGVVLTAMFPRGNMINTGNKPVNVAKRNIFFNGRLSNIESTSFIVILVTSLFLPFSLDGYEPLCAVPRHFLYLMPFAVLPVVNYICTLQTKRSYAYMTLFVLAVACGCMMSTQNKWQWMIHLMIFVSFFLRFVGWPGLHKLAIAAIWLALFVSIFESLFFLRSAWFKDMQVLEMRIPGGEPKMPLGEDRNVSTKSRPDSILQPVAYYFADHDNMMHWKLLKNFDETGTRYFNLHPQPFKIYKIYYKFPEKASFIPGWLIINNAYPSPSVNLLEQPQSPQALNLLQTIFRSGHIYAYYIGTPEQLKYVRSLMTQ
jgi:hypothetical protein